MSEQKPIEAKLSCFDTDYVLQFTQGKRKHPRLRTWRDVVDCRLIAAHNGEIHYLAIAYRRPGDAFNLIEAQRAALTKLCKNILNEDMRRALWEAYLLKVGIKRAPAAQEMETAS